MPLSLLQRPPSPHGYVIACSLQLQQRTRMPAPARLLLPRCLTLAHVTYLLLHPHVPFLGRSRTLSSGTPADTPPPCVPPLFSSHHHPLPHQSQAPPSFRAGCLRKLAALMRENADKLAELDGVSMGQPVSIHNRYSGLAGKSLEHAADLAETYLGGTASTNTPGFLNLSLKVPYGVVTGICPWNVPLIMMANKMGAATAAGNVMIIKSSEKSPLSTSFVAGLSVEAGFPPGVFQVLTGAGLTGKLLAE